MKRRIARYGGAALASLVSFTFTVMVLIVVSDAALRLWYQNAPVSLFVDFRSVHVEERDGRPVLLFERVTRRTYEASYNRALVTEVGQLQLCGKTAPGFFPIEPDDDGIVELPLERTLAANCADVLEDRTLLARLRMTLVILLPYDTRRLQTRVSEPFVIWQDEGQLHVMPAEQNPVEATEERN